MTPCLGDELSKWNVLAELVVGVVGLGGGRVSELERLGEGLVLGDLDGLGGCVSDEQAS